MKIKGITSKNTNNKPTPKYKVGDEVYYFETNLVRDSTTAIKSIVTKIGNTYPILKSGNIIKHGGYMFRIKDFRGKIHNLPQSSLFTYEFLKKRNKDAKK